MPKSNLKIHLHIPARPVVVQPRTTGVKRAMDIGISAFLLLTLAPLGAIVALLIRWTDGGPALFWQTRVGYLGRRFRFPKFRSMVVNAEVLRTKLEALNSHGNSITFKMQHDPRVTWIGRIIRKLSIDELPQLWCVLKGDMSLVGPRPPLESEVNAYSAADWRRLEAVPGLTCTWQVSGRGDIPFAKQVALDVDYIANQSVALDLKILAQTLPAVFSGRGAY